MGTMGEVVTESLKDLTLHNKLKIPTSKAFMGLQWEGAKFLGPQTMKS